MSTRIAMWSGPRNLSTAMMRAFENRADTSVVDEPFYACYLAASGEDHPMTAEVIASQSTDWGVVAEQLTSARLDTALQYQKQMTHHMLPGVDIGFCRQLKNAFLIRHPRDVVRSYLNKRDAVTADDIGINRQWALYQEIAELSETAVPVIDSEDVLRDPRRALTVLCAALDIEFDDAMLEWPAGRRDSDGVWAPHWYQSVEASTGFEPWRERDRTFAHPAIDDSMASFEALAAVRLRL
ncbi:MAG: HAD family hydrolase [Pseudomonadota bacterium]